MDLDIDTKTTFKASGSSGVYQRFLTVGQYRGFVCLAIGVGTELPEVLWHNTLLLRSRDRDDIHVP